MKKLFNIFIALSVLLFASCQALSSGSEDSDNLVINIGTDRIIIPKEGEYIPQEDTIWTVMLYKMDGTVQARDTGKIRSLSFNVPTDEYELVVRDAPEGCGCKFEGRRNVIVNSDSVTSVTIVPHYVFNSEEKGGFEYKLTFENTDYFGFGSLLDNIADNLNDHISAKLTPVFGNSGLDEVTLYASMDVQSSSLLVFKPSDETQGNFTITPGYYRLSILLYDLPYDAEMESDLMAYKYSIDATPADNLVLIDSGKTTMGFDYVKPNFSRTIYVTNDVTDFNGVNADHPMFITSALDYVKDIKNESSGDSEGYTFVYAPVTDKDGKVSAQTNFVLDADHLKTGKIVHIYVSNSISSLDFQPVLKIFPDGMIKMDDEQEGGFTLNLIRKAGGPDGDVVDVPFVTDGLYGDYVPSFLLGKGVCLDISNAQEPNDCYLSITLDDFDFYNVNTPFLKVKAFYETDASQGNLFRKPNIGIANMDYVQEHGTQIFNAKYNIIYIPDFSDSKNPKLNATLLLNPAYPDNYISDGKDVLSLNAYDKNGNKVTSFVRDNSEYQFKVCDASGNPLDVDFTLLYEVDDDVYGEGQSFCYEKIKFPLKKEKIKATACVTYNDKLYYVTNAFALNVTPVTSMPLYTYSIVDDKGPESTSSNGVVRKFYASYNGADAYAEHRYEGYEKGLSQTGDLVCYDFENYSLVVANKELKGYTNTDIGTGFYVATYSLENEVTKYSMVYAPVVVMIDSELSGSQVDSWNAFTILNGLKRGSGSSYSRWYFATSDSVYYADTDEINKNGDAATVGIHKLFSIATENANRIIQSIYAKGNYLYAAIKYSGDEDTVRIFRFTYDQSGTIQSSDLKQNYTNVDIGINNFVSSTESMITDYSNYSDKVDDYKVTDMLLHGGYLYVTVKSHSSWYRNNFNCHGGILRISNPENSMNVDTTFASSNPDCSYDKDPVSGEAKGLIGWYSGYDSTDKEFGNQYFGDKYYSESHEIESYYFWGPEKMLAIKEDEIYIADQGLYLDDGSLIDRNRVIKFNLSSKAMEGTELNNGETFNEKASMAYGECSYPYAYFTED